MNEYVFDEPGLYAPGKGGSFAIKS